MITLLVLVGCVAAPGVSGLTCRAKEYITSGMLCCPMCHEGTFVRRDCTTLSGTRCSPCGGGTFTNQPNGLDRCFPCTSCDPGHGLLVKQMCTTTSDTVCDVSSGYFCRSLADDTGCNLAEKHSRCGAGQRIKEAGTSRNDTTCEDCPKGSFSEEGLTCRAWTSCPKTQRKIKEGSSSSDAVCSSASRSRYISQLPPLLLLCSVTLVGLVTRG